MRFSAKFAKILGFNWEISNMRILQSKISTAFINRSDNPARSLHAWVVGSGLMEVLVDDQGISTKIKPLAIVAPDADEGIAFAAKDSETLVRGFKYLADSGKTKGKREFYLRERSEQNLAALAISWSDGPSRHSNKASAAILTVGHNIKQVLIRGMIVVPLKLKPSSKKFWQDSGIVERIQSVSDNMDKAGRDGAMISRGAALYVCSGVQLPHNLRWGRPYRQIGDILTLGMLATVANKLFTD